jgi:hypothetical protein
MRPRLAAVDAASEAVRAGDAGRIEEARAGLLAAISKALLLWPRAGETRVKYGSNTGQILVKFLSERGSRARLKSC